MTSKEQDQLKQKLLHLLGKTEKVANDNPEALRQDLKRYLEQTQIFFQNAISPEAEKNKEAQNAFEKLLRLFADKGLEQQATDIHTLPSEIKKWFGEINIEDLIKQSSENSPAENKKLLAGHLRHLADNIDIAEPHKVSKKKIKENISVAVQNNLDKQGFKFY